MNETHAALALKKKSNQHQSTLWKEELNWLVDLRNWLLHSLPSTLLIAKRIEGAERQTNKQINWMKQAVLAEWNWFVVGYARGADLCRAPTHSKRNFFSFRLCCLPSLFLELAAPPPALTSLYLIYLIWGKRRRKKEFIDGWSESEWRQLSVKPITNHSAMWKVKLFNGGGSCASFTSLHFIHQKEK